MSERTREFPCSRMDLPRVERWFVRQAGEGKMISRLNMGLGNGVFEDILGRECHFCIRPYPAKLDKTVLGSEEFLQFRQRFEDLGWKFQCGLMNLAVFYSGDGERPAEPPEDRQETQKRLLQVTAGVELGYVLMDLFWSAFSVLLLSYVLWDSRYRYCMERGAAPELFAAVYGIALLTVFLCMTVYRALPHLQMRRTLRRGIQSPKRLVFWDRWASIALCSAALAQMQMLVAWVSGWRGSLLLCGLTMVMAPVNLILRYVWNKKARPHSWEKPLLCCGLAELTVLGLALIW